VGGGPAGLYFSLLIKLRAAQHEVTVLERNATGASHGWGVTLGQDVLDMLKANDPASGEAVEHAGLRWTEQAVRIGTERVLQGGYSIRNIGRQALVDILASRARDAGVRVEYGRAAEPEDLRSSDLVVAADGAQSRLRSAADFGTTVRTGRNKYIWLGSDAAFDVFNYFFVPTAHGWVWAYAYQFGAYEPGRAQSTFIVECSPETWTGLGFAEMAADDAAAVLGDLFAEHLAGHWLTARLPDGTAARWLNFPTVTNQRWHAGNLVLAGDCAHTAHYSLGQGTKMALEDAVVLAGSLTGNADLKSALTAYEVRRKAELLRPLSEARCSSEWFENLPRFIGLDPHQFATLLQGRWSPLVSVLPPRLSYRLHQAARQFTVLNGIRSRVGPAAKVVYGRRKSVLR
jgi:2-polyprenyl-6-methoxyphenol hydroxylase-like FAD-dependent oxidoreductase